MAPGNHTRKKCQKGFTLVELAISLMIIGLLIAGILKGSEIIDNARNVQLTRQLKGYETAVAAFRSMYEALPGDMLLPAEKLPGCTAAPCSTEGDGNDLLGPHTVAAGKIYGMTDLVLGELRNFWVHLSKASLIKGVDANYNGGYSGNAGVELPEGPHTNSVVSVFRYSSATWGDTVNFIPGNYYVVRSIEDDEAVLSPASAFYVDSKLDDGEAASGNIRAAAKTGIVPANDCLDDPHYALQIKEKTCLLMMRIR